MIGRLFCRNFDHCKEQSRNEKQIHVKQNIDGCRKSPTYKKSGDNVCKTEMKRKSNNKKGKRQQL
jgi:hypothetical protein